MALVLTEEQELLRDSAQGFVDGQTSVDALRQQRDVTNGAGYDEAPLAAHMKGREIHIEIDVGVGRGRARVWTCDLTHGYITINADYRT